MPHPCALTAYIASRATEGNDFPFPTGPDDRCESIAIELLQRHSVILEQWLHPIKAILPFTIRTFAIDLSTTIFNDLQWNGSAFQIFYCWNYS